MSSCLILGYGYTAKFLKPLLQKGFGEEKVFTTSRTNLGHVRFDLTDEKTWTNLPQADFCVWTFPPEPLELVQAFFKKKPTPWKKWVTVGSTGALQVTQTHEVVNEETSLDASMPRVAGEEFLRQQGGITLLSSGIYGPGRDPREWVKKGWVGRSEKFVNMIHVEDLSQFILAALEKGEPGSLYIASDNQPRTWEEIITAWEENNWVKDVPQKTSQRPSKRVDNSKTLAELGVKLKHPDFISLDF